MIRTFEVKLNAAYPELPLFEASAIVGSPSTAIIRNVPASVGNWRITAVYVDAEYPDGSAITIEAAKSAAGIWVATVPMTEFSGRVKSGFVVKADGIDENGQPVMGYTLGVADFAVYTRDLVVVPGEPSYTLRFFNTVPAVPKTGDVAAVDGVLKMYNGTAWVDFSNVDLSNYYTKQETDEAIEAVAAYYITYTAAGAAFPTRAALVNAETVYSGGVPRVPTRNDYAVVLADETHDGAEYRYIYGVAEGAGTGQWEAQYPIETNDYRQLSNKPTLNGKTLEGNVAISGDEIPVGGGDGATLKNAIEERLTKAEAKSQASDLLGRYFHASTPYSQSTANLSVQTMSMYPSVFGIPTGGVLKAMSFRTSTEAGNTVPVYLHIVDPDNLTASVAVAGPVTMADANADYWFYFEANVALTADKTYTVEFRDGPTIADAAVSQNLRILRGSGTYGIWVPADGSGYYTHPIVTGKWSSTTLEAELALKANVADLGGYVPWATDSASNKTAVTIGSRLGGGAVVGPRSLTMGEENTATAANAFAEGYYTNATAADAHAEGYYTNASGSRSHTEGDRTAATNTGAHAEGYYTTAGGQHSHAEGDHTETKSGGEHAEGKWNLSSQLTHPTAGYSLGYTLHSIGCGLTNVRRNASEVFLQANGLPLYYVYGIGGYDGTNPLGTGVEDLASAVNGKSKPYRWKNIVDDDALGDKTINFVWPESGEDYDITVTFPAANQNQVARDFIIAYYRRPGNNGSLIITPPTNARLFGDGFDSISIEEGQIGVYLVTELTNNYFMVKAQVLEEVTA